MLSFSYRTGKLFSLFLILFFALPLVSKAQSKASLLKLIKQTQTDLENYGKLNPFGEEYMPLDSFSLSKKETQELITIFDIDQALSPDHKKVETFAAIFYFQDKIINTLIQIMLHPKFNEVDIAQLLSTGELYIVVSDDGKLYNFSLPEKTGGSYRSHLSLVHYTDYDFKDSLTLMEFNDHFAGDGYGNIYNLETNEGTKYVLTGFVRGCNYCFETFVELVSFSENGPNEEFRYAVNNRNWEEGVTYHPETQTIEVNYHTDDLTPYCHCEEQFEWDGADVDEYNVPNLSCKCRYIFNGSNFELVEEAWKKEDLPETPN